MGFTGGITGRSMPVSQAGISRSGLRSLGMATIHTGTTLEPTKLELLAGWLPRQPWYRGSESPALTRAGGFRLDDPAGAVGLELMVVVEGAAGAETAYLVPMTYRAAPLSGAEEA